MKREFQIFASIGTNVNIPKELYRIEMRKHGLRLRVTQQVEYSGLKITDRLSDPGHLPYRAIFL